MDDDGNLSRSIVIDSGSCTCRAGFAEDDGPCAVFPSVVGRRRDHSVRAGINIEECYIGNDAQEKRDLLSLRYPVKRGVITDWDDMEKIWHHLFYTALATNPEDHPVLLTEPVFNGMANREKTMEVMFETFHTPAMFLEKGLVLSKNTCGRVSCIVLNVGDGAMQVLPIYEGYRLNPAARRLDFAGCDLTSYLTAMLRERDLFLASSPEMEVVREMKEKLAYVALDYKAEVSKAATSPTSVEKDYSLPDGQVIRIGSERFRCGEALFQPSLTDKEMKSPGIHEMLYESMMNCEIDTRRDLWCNIILAGGGTMLPGLADRLRHEMVELAPPTAKVKVIDSPERKYSSWIGGSILASLSVFRSMLVARSEYDEWGPSIVHRKCP